MTRLFVPFIGPSTNAIYAGMHWAKRKKEKDACKQYTRSAIAQAGIGPIGQQVDIVFRARLGKGVRVRDTSNYSFSNKMIEDALVECGLLPDDRGEYVRRVISEPPEIDRKAETGTHVEIIPVTAQQEAS